MRKTVKIMIFEGAVMGVNNIYKLVFKWNIADLRFQKQKELSFYHSNQEIIAIQRARIIIFKSDGLILGTPIWYTLSYYLSRKEIFCVKNSAIRNYKNYSHNFEFMTQRVVGSGGGARL